MSPQLNMEVLRKFGTYPAPNSLLACLARQLRADRLSNTTSEFRAIALLTLMRLASKYPYHIVPDRSMPLNPQEYPLCVWYPEQKPRKIVLETVSAIKRLVPPQTLFRKLIQRDGRIFLIGQ